MGNAQQVGIAAVWHSSECVTFEQLATATAMDRPRRSTRQPVKAPQPIVSEQLGLVRAWRPFSTHLFKLYYEPTHLRLFFLSLFMTLSY